MAYVSTLILKGVSNNIVTMKKSSKSHGNVFFNIFTKSYSYSGDILTCIQSDILTCIQSDMSLFHERDELQTQVDYNYATVTVVVLYHWPSWLIFDPQGALLDIQPIVGLMLGHRQRRWPNINPAMGILLGQRGHSTLYWVWRKGGSRINSYMYVVHRRPEFVSFRASIWYIMPLNFHASILAIFFFFKLYVCWFVHPFVFAITIEIQ